MIQFEVSRDPRLLEQYYALREQCFRTDLGIPDFDGSEEERDRQGQILIAHEDGKVIGGVRISPEVTVKDHLSELGVAAHACCIWERFVLDPVLRTVKLARQFLAHMIETSNLLGFQHAVMLSSLRNARFYRACHTALGVTFEIQRPVPEYATGEFAGLEHYLSVAHLREATRLQLVA